MADRSQSFHAPAGSQPAASAAPGAARASPFASGPVAMVNPIRPTGAFPGTVARAAPTQLSTPLVPQRRATSPPKSAQSVPPAVDLFGSSSSRSAATYATPDPFGSLAPPAPPFQVQGSVQQPELFPRVERAGAESLFGAPTAATPPGRVSQPRAQYQNLFGSPERAPAPNSAPPIRRTSQSFSYGQQPGAQQAQTPPSGQLNQQQPPPAAAPFLGYADAGNARTQSYRASGPSPPTSTGSRTASSSPPRANSSVPSADELLEQFLSQPVDAKFRDPRNASAGNPPASKLLLADIPDSIHSLESLYKQKRWKSLTKKALAMLQSPASDPAATLAIRSWWLAGLIKDGHFDNAASVLDQIGDLDEPSIAMSSNDDHGYSKVYVPIRLRLLQALLSKCKGNFPLHEKQLYQLISKLRRVIEDDITTDILGVSGDVASRWMRIAQFALVSHLVQQQKFSLALRVCSKIEVEKLTLEEKIIVLSRLGRINLQMGDLSTAEKIFALAKSCAELLKASRAVPTDEQANQMAQLDARLLLNDGLLYFAQNKQQEALSAFDGVLELESRRVTDFYSEHDSQPGPQDDELFLEEDLICAAINNYSICALYCCDVKGAVAALERMIRANPARFLNGVVVFNLSSLYDLVFDNANSVARKEMMKKLAEMFDLEHIDPAAFRV